ncbi:MAG: transketolase [Oscillospiraceae bacterium]|nr:transketolase [Oscillospiraceae bacterium]
MDQATKKNLKILATKIRRHVVEMIGPDSVGHLGGSCSSADIVAVLYGKWLRHAPQNPRWEGRDKLIFSKGHACIAQYAVLCEYGYFPREELTKLKTLGAMLQGHPDRNKTPGIEANTGSLGQGLSICNGMALAARLDNKDTRVYCILGDAELAEGQVWEAAMTSAVFGIDNLVAIVDLNGLSATGAIADRFNLNPVADKFRGFGWNVLCIDGHDLDAIDEALAAAKATKGVPTAIIAKTVKGKGVSFAENVPGFHNGLLTAQQYRQACRELDEVLEQEAAK